jgi:hypothetical protein
LRTPYNSGVRNFIISGLACISPLFLAACFNPNISQLTLLCDAERPECPEGQACQNNQCHPIGSDLAGLQEDQGGTDASADASFDLAPVSGCADGKGKAVGVAFACAGSFGVLMARKLCATGWHICTSAAGLDPTTCDGLSGFFIAEVPAYYVGTVSNETCGTSIGGQMWYGCGNRADFVMQGVKGCGGFRKLMDCRASGWNCNMMHKIDQTSNGNGGDGVLCCL